MKKTILTIIGVVAVVALGVYVFGGSPAESPTVDSQSATSSATTFDADLSTSSLADLSAANGTYAVNVSSSEISWSAGKSFVEGYEDSGTIPVASGSIAVASSTVTGGSVTLDVANISVSETGAGGGAGRLQEHLRSEDFFDVSTYPTAELRIISAEMIGENQYEITADLTMHGQTNQITFPATVGLDAAGSLIVEASTAIDRTRWGIRFRSTSFFSNLGDQAIADMVDINISLEANQ